MKMKQDNLPLFSVIIPQKNRAEFLVHTLRTCMLQDYPNFEIIVSDDCSDDNSVEVIEELAKIDSRIKLFAHSHHLGMRDNFEFALNQVKPGYVIALGGDDGLTPGCIWEMYRILSSTGRELLTWSMAGFSYPNKEGGPNIFYVRRFKSDIVKIIQSEDFLNQIAKSFHYQVDECPMFYMKGVASTNLIEKVKSRTPDHCFYNCPTPDGFSGVVLAGEVEDFVYTSKPLSIGGDTQKSQGKNYMRSDEKSRFEANQFFNDNIRRTMHSELASQQYSPLTTLMTADYLLTARDLPGWPGKFEMFSFKSLIEKSFECMSNSPFADEVLERELKILKQIAIQHNLLDFFNEQIKKKRKVPEIEIIYGFLITNSIRIDGRTIGINNIYDASLAVNFIYNSYKNFSIRSVWAFVKRMAQALLRRKKYSFSDYPQVYS